MVVSKKQAAEKKGAAVAQKAPAKAAKKDKAAKGRLQVVKDFFAGVKMELKKIHWPTRREAMVYTGVVLTTVTLVAMIIWILDSILSGGMALIIK
ncbi:preprotein translocase subunit SecE [Desulfohalotomaculum tongense]|uniref:preprotein translocase subunit SecE n=1 Tax=Desulforadius tongensis TaxID=1216062 RepID=UPI001958B18A|nr:preprotein translocase subunit SecE [Desulforadius tongensis]MBM7853812.1 preprotein translocase subunit SecE [Desulforadius tongensis]